ncbi:hypothetical protein [Tautonia marina]|uniref:hypothetical protein n=1 Tax=Tautonia marina TaxID=2653855 RepID=UPI001260C2FF|nr:hypothetical protein [Tautonia marina]
MKFRRTCTHCQGTFLVTEERLGQLVTCPKCGQESRLPATLGELTQTSPQSDPEASPTPSVLIGPAELEAEETEPSTARRRKRLIPFLLGAIGGLLVAALIFWPIFRWSAPDARDLADLPDAPRPIDPVERTARTFLDALVAQDAETIDRLAVLTDPPAIASFEDVQRDPSEDETIRGSFAPLAELNRQIASNYTYDPAIDRFRNANPLGVAADFMDDAEQLRQENEAADIYSRIAGGTADEQLDAAVEFAEQFAKLTQNALPRKELVPTYAQLVEDADPPLPPEAEALALTFGEETATWEELLDRPFFTIKADGPFVLDRAEAVATIQDRLASPGDTPRRLRLGLARFRLDAIDTGWKVVSARREDPAPPTDSTEPYRSPGLEEGP